MLDNLKPGDAIRCTVSQEPRAAAKTKTIARLMRRDADITAGLKRAQELRRKRMKVYIRGGRDWYSREKAAKITIVRKGATWTMAFTPDLANALRSIETYLNIEKA